MRTTTPNVRPRDARSAQRRGAETVEFAIALPVLILLVFTGIEFSRVNMIRNSIENAAYEGAREGIVPGASAADCRAAAESLLKIVQVNGAKVTVTPDPLPNSADSVEVTVTVPITTANGYVTPRFYLGKQLSASVALGREKPFVGSGGSGDDDDD